MLRRGELKSFTGVSAPYEEPEAADLVVDTETVDVDGAVDAIIALLEERGVLS